MRMTIKNLFTRWYSRQRRLYGIFSALMFLVIITSPTNVWAAYSGSGSGTSEDPYLVTSEAQLTEVLGTCGGYAKLTANFLNSTNVCNIQVNTTVTLDLNGKTIENYYTSSHNHYEYSYDIFIINLGADLTITDNSSEKNGTIKCADGPKGAFHNKGTLTILGGIITQNSGNVGGGIYNDDGAVLTISGGTISENSYYGIYNAFGATCNITGGTITNNGSSGNGGIYNLGTLNISGTPNISGNRSYNIYLPTGKTITVAGALSNTTLIGITMQTPGDFTNAYEGAYAYFVSDNTDYEVINTAENKASLRSCWAGLNVLLSQEGTERTVTLTKDYKAVSTDGHLLVESGKKVTLDLNGHTLNRNLGSAVNEGCVIKNQGTLIINGTGGGVIKGGFSSSGGGGILNEGTLTINGGTIKENKTTSLGAGIYNVTGKTLTLNGGVIDNNQNTTDDGGGIYNQGTFTLTSGSITNNKVTGTSKNGGGIYNTGTMSINGGTIQNNTATGKGAGIYHDGTAFNLQGSPTISSNTVNSSPKNVYLTANHHIITITGAIGEITPISLNMETLGVFTSGLSGNGTSAKFSSEAGNSVKLTDNGSNEAELITYWNYLNRQIQTNGTYTLESGKVYEAGSSDSYLHVPSGKTVVLNLNGRTLNRGLYNSTAIASGCVILNEGTLTINGTAGSITGGNNDDSNEIKGGGICNKGTLTYEIGTIGNNKTATLGGGIYNTGTLTIKGGTINNNTASGDATANGIYHNGSQFYLEGNPNINVYLATGKTINISNALTNSSNSPINIATADDYLIFTSGLNGNGDANKFTANQTGKGIGLNSAGEAIIGPKYNIGRNHTGTSATLYIKDVTSTQTAVEGEVVKVKVVPATGGIPISLSYSPGALLSTYPKSNEEYSFVMPARPVTVESVCRWGGYCGAASLEDIKYYIDENQVLKFITKDDNDYSMATYGAGSAPWVNQTYTSVEIPKRLIAISDYAFCDKNQHLASFTVDADNPNFKAAGGLLFNKGLTQLICYPSGKTDANTYTVPAAVTAIQDGAFAFNTTLTAISVAGGSPFTAGADGVLYNGTSLICYPAGKTETSYTIAATVTAIKPYAFQSCSNLDYVYVLPVVVPTGGVAMFDGTKNSLKILVPSGGLSDYKTNWSTYSSKIYAIDGTTLEITLTTDKDAYDYFGSEVKPDVTQVRSTAGDGKVLVKDVDYSSTYTYTNNNALGTGTVQVTGIGNYAGITATKNFDITKRVVISGATGQYSTYYHTEGVTLSEPSGLQAYTISSINWETGATDLSARISCIPPNTPVLLWKNGNCNGTYHLKVVTASSASHSPDFKGVTADTPYNTLMSDNKAIYVIKGGQFYRATSGTLKANHCYLAMPNSSPHPVLSRMIVGSGDGTTGINTLPNDDGEDMSGNWYTLDGRKLQGKPTQKGVYISNGKKMVIK